MLSPGRLRVVLVRTRNPLNIGSVARVMSNLGFPELRLVEPYDPSFREARSAVGAADLLRRARVFSSIAEAVADCTLVVGTTAVRDRELHQPLKDLAAAAPQIRRTLARSNVAILFGCEKTGLSTGELAHCNLLLRIPTRDQHVSLNLAQAVAITLYELARTGTKTSRSKSASVTSANSAATAPATAAELERLTVLLLDSLRASDYIKRNTEASTELKLRRMIRRLALSTEDAEQLQGMLRKILYKLQHP